MLPSIDALRCFVAASKHLNFRKAARTVALTPSAFGQRIKQLETELGTVLFLRTTRSVALTEAGLSLLPHATKCLDAAIECSRAVRGEAGPPPMELVVGTRHELGISWLVPELDALGAALPHVRFDVYFGSGPDLLLRTRTLEIDCAVTSSRLVDPKLDSFRLHREDYVFVGSAKLLKSDPVTKPQHAKAHTLLDISAELPLFHYFRDAPGGWDSMEFSAVRTLGTIEAIRQRVVAGAGIAVLPEYLMRPDLKAGRVRKILPSVRPIHDYFRLVFRADDPRKPTYEALARALLAVPLR